MSLLRLPSAIIFALLAATLILLFEVGAIALLDLLFDAHFLPRGAGWAILPIIGGIAGWKFGWNIEVPIALGASAKEWLLETKQGRGTIAGFSAWIAIWTLYCSNSDSFGYYGWRDDDWLAYFGGLLLGPTLVYIIISMVKWVSRGK